MPAELAVTLAATESDRLLQAEALVRAYCGWHVAPVRRETWLLDVTDVRVLTLPTLRLKRVESLRIDGELIDAADYEWSASGLLTGISYGWTESFTREPYLRRSGFRRLALDVEHGFDSVPVDVSAVVQSMASRAVANPNGVTREQVGPFAYSYSGASSTEVLALSLLSGERSVLDAYKLPSRP